MGYNQWRGDAQAVAQVSKLLVGGTPATADWIETEINRKKIRYTLLVSDTAITAASALYALVAASSIPEYQEAAWSYTDGNAYFFGTSNNPGVPFTVTANVGGSTGTTTLTASTPTASTGPSQYDDPANWSLDTVPSGSDNVVIDGGSDLLYGAGTIAGASIEVRAAFQGNMGLAQRNPLNYYEYRTRYITLNSAVVKIGEGTGAGSSRLLVKGITSSTWTVYATSQRESEGFPALDIDLTGNPTAVNVSGGDVGLCVYNESTARTVASVALASDGARLTIGRTVTVTALDEDNGQSDVWGIVTAVVLGKGVYNQEDGSLGSIAAYGGTANLKHAGTVTSAVFRGQGKDNAPPVCNCTFNNLVRVFTNSEFTGGAALLDPNKTVTFTNPYQTDGASYANSDIGPRFSVQRS